MHSPAKKCAASRHVIIYSLQLTKSNRIKVSQITKCLFRLTLVLLEIGPGPWTKSWQSKRFLALPTKKYLHYYRYFANIFCILQK